jgi:uncharacterized protein YecE (DUF72 family)
LRPFPTAVEVRHGSWGTRAGAEFFRDSDVPLCGVDQPLIGNSLGPDAFAPGTSQAYFRLHGRNQRNWFNRDAGRDDRYDYLYSRDELASWRERIESVPAGVKRLFVVLNNHFRGQAVANALQLRSMLTGRRQISPPGLITAFPALKRELRAGTPPHNQDNDTQLGLFGNEDDN